MSERWAFATALRREVRNAVERHVFGRPLTRVERLKLEHLLIEHERVMANLAEARDALDHPLLESFGRIDGEDNWDCREEPGDR